MNRIYSLVWNSALRTMQVASELAMARRGGTCHANAHPCRRSRLPLAIASLLAMGLLSMGPAPTASAAPACTWNAASGNWTTVGNWSNCNGTFPGTGASAEADASVGSSVGGSVVTLNTANVNAGTLTIGTSGNGTEVDVTGTSATNNNFAAIEVTSGNNFAIDNGASVTTAGALTMDGGVEGYQANTYIDLNNGEGGSTLNVGGTLNNNGGGARLLIGNPTLSAATTVSAAALSNPQFAVLTLQGNNSNATQATLNIAGPAGFGTAGQVSGHVAVGGDALIHFGSGGLTSIASGAYLTLGDANARISTGADTTTNSALTGLASNAGELDLYHDASVTTTGGFTNSNTVNVDTNYGGGSTLNIGGTLTNTGILNIGYTTLGTATEVSATALVNNSVYRDVNLTGNTSNMIQATLNIAGAAGDGTAGTLSGDYSLQGDALLQFGSGGITSIASGGSLFLNGTAARISIGPGPANSALTGLASNAGTFYLQGGAAVTTTGGFANSGNTELESYGNGSSSTLKVGGALTINDGTLGVDGTGGPGGSVLTVGGTLTNNHYLVIGTTALSTATNVSAPTLVNTGTLDLTGNTASATATTRATLDIAGAAGFGTAGQVTGAVNLQGNALLEFGSGGLTSIAAGSQLALSGSGARISIGPGATNSALTGLASNAGNFYLHNGATVTTTSGLNNSGATWVDWSGGTGGSSLNVGGTLTNSSALNIGNTSLSANTLVTATALANTGTGTINLTGSSPNLATLTVNGPATNAGTVNINAYGNLNVTGANNSYTQSAGTTTIAANGTLSATNIANDGGVLQGTGTVNGTVTNVGTATVAGGINGQPGTLTINGNFFNGFSTGGNGGTVASYLSPSGNNTQITITGVPHLAGGTIQGNLFNGLAYTAGQSFTVMNFAPGTLSGLFGSVQNGTTTATAGTSTNLGGGLTLGVVYNDHAGNVQLDVVNTPATTTETWNGGTGNWTTAGDWSSNAAPQFFSKVTIGATSSGNVTLGQDATIESLAINGGNTLAYDTTTPATLTVGGGVTIQTGGAITATTGDKLVLGGNFANAGTTTLGGNASLYGLGSFDNKGSVAISGSFQVLNSAINHAGATITLSNGSFTSTTLTNAGTISGSGQLLSSTSAAIDNTVLIEASGGTLHANNGIQGIIGNITVDAGATLDLSHSTVGSQAATLTQNGTLALGSQNITVSSDYTNANFGSGNSFNKTAGVTGTGQIDAAVNVAQAVSGSDITGGTTATPTLAFGNVHVGSTDNATYAIGNTGTSGPALRGAIQTSVNGGNITDAGLSGTGVTAGNYGPVTTGAQSSGYTVTYAPTAAGALSGQAVHIANNFANVGEQTLGITGAAYAYASPTITSGHNPPYNFGVVQVGGSYTDGLTITNTLVASNAAYQEGLNASFGVPINTQLTGAGSITNLGAGLSDSKDMVVTLKPTSAGAIGGTVTVNFASNGTGTSGLGTTSLASQNLNYTWAFSGTVVNQASPSITPNPVAFGNVRMGSTQSQALNVANLTTTAPQASLDAQLQTPTGAATSNNLSSISQLAAGTSDNTSFVLGLNTANAGAQSGAAVINLQSDSTPNGCTSNCIVNLASDTVNVSGNVYRLANPTLNTSTVTLAARVGDTAPTATISVSNTSPDAYTEGLAASQGTAPAGFTNSGSITNLAAQGTDNSSLKVALNTTTAGTFSGNDAVTYTSNGVIDNAAPIAVGSGNVALAGKVYTPAVAQVNTASPINFGIVHVGDGGGTLSKSVSVTNSAAVTALNDTLRGSITTGGSPFSGSGSLGTAGLAAGQTSTAMAVGLNTATAGVYSGTANLAFASHDADLTDLALAGTTLAASAQVNLYAALGFNLASGLGSLSGSAATGYTLNFGNLLQNSGTDSSTLAFLNANPLADQFFTDLLSSQGTISSGSGFSLSGDSVNNLAGGDSQGGFDIGLGTGTLGLFHELLKFNINSSNSSGYNADIGTVGLTLQGDVVAMTTNVPEPDNLGIFGGGLIAMLLFIEARRRKLGQSRRH